MARNTTQKPAEDKVGIDNPIPAAHAVTLAEEKTLQMIEGYSSDRDLVNQLMGQAQAFQAISKFTTVVSLSKLQYIKENKLYRASKGMKTPDGRELSGTWAEFVEALGMSVGKVDEDLQNLAAFGEEALASLTNVGAGYRELRQLRKLPEDVRQEIAGQLVNLEDKEEIVALIDDLAARHAQEKSELEKKVAELEADAEANGQVISDKNSKIDDLEREIYKLRNKTGDWHPRVFEICNETNTILGVAAEQLDKLDTMRDVILNEDFGEEERESAVEMMACVYYDAVAQLVGRIAEISDACDQVFIGYKEKARPLLQVFGQDGAN
jgi:polyhydroxyalkanoate synthesis regulator phasin